MISEQKREWQEVNMNRGIRKKWRTSKNLAKKKRCIKKMRDGERGEKKMERSTEEWTAG